MRKSGLTGDEAYVLAKHGKTTEDLGPLKKELSLLKEDISNKITKFYASNQGEIHITDSDNGKVQDMVLYGKSEQKQYKGINLFLPDTKKGEYIEVSIPKGSSVFWITNGTPATGGNFRLLNEDKTEIDLFPFALGTTSSRKTLKFDVKYVQNLVEGDFDLSKICLGVGSESIYEPYTGGQPSPSPDYPQEIKSVVNPTIKLSNGDGTESQTVTLPYVLNAIPVNSGGNVTINGQQYVADYVDVERGKLVRMIIQKKLKELHWDNTTRYQTKLNESNGYMSFRSKNIVRYLNTKQAILCKNYIFAKNAWDVAKTLISYVDGLLINDIYSNFGLENWSKDAQISSNIFGDTTFFAELVTPQEIDLTSDQIQAFKSLATNYPVTNIEVSSDQLDGLTVFNYPISMANGWNYVKQQLNDNRDYIYDMDTQSAEAYVNSEYAVALAELEG